MPKIDLLALPDFWRRKFEPKTAYNQGFFRAWESI